VVGTGQVLCEPQWHSALGKADVARLSLNQQGETRAVAGREWSARGRSGRRRPGSRHRL
jgi:hypothetical protein